MIVDFAELCRISRLKSKAAVRAYVEDGRLVLEQGRRRRRGRQRHAVAHRGEGAVRAVRGMGGVRYFGKKPALTLEQTEALLRDYEQWQRLHPSLLCVKVRHLEVDAAHVPQGAV